MERTKALHPPGTIDSIFVGGGTPTILDPGQMERFLQGVRSFTPDRASDMEFTMEANPGTTSPDKLFVMREGGVNRISFGVQSFDNRLLAGIGRIHDREDVYASIANARRAGFTNLSIDLMFGLPNQTISDVRESVLRALDLGLSHYSLYALKVEEHTLFHHMYQRNELPLPDEDTELEMYLLIIEMLTEAGYVQYEISNFALPGMESKHNSAYWLNQSYYGLGAGAHAYVAGERKANIRGVREYIDAVQTGLPIKESHEVSDAEAAEDFMMVGLRMLSGVSTVEFEKKFGFAMESCFSSQLTKLTGSGLLERVDDRYRLTRKGLLFGNEVFAEFI